MLAITTVRLPRSLLEGVHRHWPQLSKNPAVAALASQGKESARPVNSIKATLFLALADLEAGFLPGEAAKLRQERDALARRVAELEGRGG